MAIATGGELIILCPGINTFGEDPQNDSIIRKYGYKDIASLLDLVNGNIELANNLAVVAALIICSPENRFKVVYAAKDISRKEVESVYCNYADYDEVIKRYDPSQLQEGENIMADGEEIFYISRPAQGLWAETGRFGQYN